MKRILSIIALATGLVVTGSHALAAEGSAGSSDKTMNFRISPLGLFIGYFNVDADFKIAPEWTIGPTVSYWHFDFADSDPGFSNQSISTTMYAIGVRANWYQAGAYNSGLYVSPIVQYETATASATDSSGNSISATASTYILSGLIGYHWFWDVFNLSLGGGFALPLTSTKVELTSAGNTTDVNYSRTGQVGLALDFMLGAAF